MSQPLAGKSQRLRFSFVSEGNVHPYQNLSAEYISEITRLILANGRRSYVVSRSNLITEDGSSRWIMRSVKTAERLDSSSTSIYLEYMLALDLSFFYD